MVGVGAKKKAANRGKRNERNGFYGICVTKHKDAHKQVGGTHA